LTNVIRHANGTKVDVSLSDVGDQLVLEVQDNGRGISEAEIQNTRSIGLLGMRERAALLGGDVRFNGAHGRGTLVTVRIPKPGARTSQSTATPINKLRSRTRIHVAPSH